MLVEINLLPQKEPKKLGLILTIGSLLALLLMIGGIYYLQIHSVNNEMASVDQQISMTKNLADKEQSNAQAVESSNSVNQLKSAIDWANNYPILTVPVMRYLSSLLPERGFIQSFSYNETGTVTLSVQFDSSREAAYFLDSLTQSKWIEEVSLSSLSTTTIESNTAANSAVPNNQTNATNTTGTTSNTNNTNTAGGTNQNPAANSTNSANQTNSTTTTTVLQSDQNGTTVKQTTQNGSTGTTTNSSTANNATSSPAAANSSTSDNYLPRYTGSFEIKFNNDYIKKVLKKSKQNEEGVAGS